MDINDVARDRAEFARDMEYTKQNIEDSAMQDAIISTKSKCNGLKFWTIDDVKSKCPDAFDDCNYTDEELDQAISQIPLDDSDREEEINRILQATDDLNLDDVMGIENEEPDIESEV